MATELLANYTRWTVTSGGTDAPAAGTSQTFTVSSSTGAPAAVTGTSQFRIVDISDSAAPPEIMIVTNVSGTTWTVTRGAEGAAPWAHAANWVAIPVLSQGAITNGFAPLVPTVVCSLSSAFSSYHQAPQVVVQGTFVAPATSFKLRAQIQGYTNGAQYSGTTLSLIVGIPGTANNVGGIIGEEVTQVGTGHNPVNGTALYPVSGTAGTYGCEVVIGTILGEFASGTMVRDVVYTGATPGTTYTAQIICGEVSGYDYAFAPTASDILDGAAITPGFDTSPDNVNLSAKNIWVSNRTKNAMMCFSIGRRPLAAFEGVQPRLLYQGSLPISQTITYCAPCIDKNGIMAVYSPLASTVTLVDTKANNHSGAVIATTGAFAGNVDAVAASPDGTGFWVAVHNTSIVKINPTTGATITTWALSGYLQMKLVISNDSTVAYLWSSAYPGIISVNLSTGATTTGPPLNSVGQFALSPDGTFLLASASPSNTTWGVVKIALPTLPSLPTSGATLTYAARRGTVSWNNYDVYGVAISADSKMWFAAGNYALWGYGWTSDMAQFDGRIAGASNQPASSLVVSENEGIYIIESGGTGTRYDGGTLPQARIVAYHGSTFTCDPTSTNNGIGFAEVIL